MVKHSTHQVNDVQIAFQLHLQRQCATDDDAVDDEDDDVS